MFWYHKGKGEYRLCSAGGISKSMAAIHNLVRVAACTRISKLEGGDPATFQAAAEDEAMKGSAAVGWLAPYGLGGTLKAGLLPKLHRRLPISTVTFALAVRRYPEALFAS